MSGYSSFNSPDNIFFRVLCQSCAFLQTRFNISMLIVVNETVKSKHRFIGKVLLDSWASIIG